MSANDIYIIKEIAPGLFEVRHLDVDDTGDGIYLGLHGLREAIAAAEEGNAEYNYRIEFLEG